jgi:7-keto-8-aminopelargonate synthetase-like enzyme
LESPAGAQIVIDGRTYINFGGSSYLGLSAHPAVIDAGVAAVREFGAGTPPPRDQQVVTRAHQDVEFEAASFFDCEMAHYLAAGYLFGLVSVAALQSQFNAIFFDEFSHYCLRDAIGASGLNCHAYHHLDPVDLEATLRASLGPSQRPLIVTDGLFPTLGEIAPLAELWQVASRFNGRLLVDESHSFGVLGQHGRGARELFELSGSAALVGGSLGKAFGTCGGIIPGSAEEVAALRRTPAGRGASGGLAASAAMCARSLRYLREHPELLERLRSNIAYLKRGLAGLGLRVTEMTVPIAAFTAGSREDMMALHKQLRDEGIFVYYTSYIAAGPEGVIRCGIFADHTRAHMDALLHALSRLL